MANMALSCAKRKQGGETRRRCRCRHIHVHYHLPRRRVSLLRWLPRPRLSLLSYLLIPLVLFFALLAFVVSFFWFTLLYFVASLLSKDDNLESVKNDGIGPATASDVQDSGQEGNSEAKGKAARHAEEHLTGDSAAAEASFRRLEIKEVRAAGFSQVSRTISRMASSDACLDYEVPVHPIDDKLVEVLETISGKADLEEFSGWRRVQDVPVDWFVDEHNIKVASGSTPGDLFPSLYSTDSAEIHDLPDMDETRGMSSDFLVESKQNHQPVVPSNTSSHHHNISDEYGEEYCDDRQELSACATFEIFDFIDKHETRDKAPDASFAKDEKTGQFQSSDGSAHGRVPDEHTKGSTQEKDTKSVLELAADGVATLEDSREKREVQKVPEVVITEANAEQSIGASNQVEDSSSEKEASMVSLYSVCEDTASSSHHCFGYEDGKQEEVTKNNTPDPASAVVLCNVFENRRTPRREAFDGFENDDKAREVASQSQESLGDEADKINDDSASASASELNLKCGAPLLRRSPSQWWNLCGVVDVFAGSED